MWLSSFRAFLGSRTTGIDNHPDPTWRGSATPPSSSSLFGQNLLLRRGPTVVKGQLLFRPAPQIDEFTARAKARLTVDPEAGFPEIQAWQRLRRARRETHQYRCASEALPRRLRLDGSLPRLHPLVDLCNAISVAHAIPVAVLDTNRISGDLTLRHARADEEHLTFAGTTERPEPGKVIFADTAGRAHARRWTNRQSCHSAVRAETTNVLIVAEALHATAADLLTALLARLGTTWPAPTGHAVLTGPVPAYDVPPIPLGATHPSTHS
ncbi:phenylalanine--tRNA ligase beta subunit-related protein [Micromonospora lupini]|uniref:B3/B4 domain-containing protein n=1 Tax=Micromonospora lupini TaxID=285679 RepID=UPI00224E688D|nr:phenylalanine--tRNA ligase beta subunit-related protein [Micromonospora lupini]MCX5064311.1 phenylalanine--tRNA ligase beta subunit-related protein [Micromonospora lupini]